MARPTIDDQQFEENCSMAHADASQILELTDLNNELLQQIYNRWPQAKDWLARILENNGLIKRYGRDTQRQMRSLLDGEQKKRTDTDRLGKLKLK